MQSIDRVTCEGLYKTLMEAAEHATFLRRSGVPHADPRCSAGNAREVLYAHRAFGFIAGQAEKVFSGVCPAFMIQPQPAWLAWSRETIAYICHHYGLDIYEDALRGELWGCADAQTRLKIDLFAANAREYGYEDSARWHTMRALLCGIPDNRIAPAYHERAGHGESCEPGMGGETHG